MGKMVWLGTLALLLGGCPARVASYSPRLDPTDAHREAVEAKNCRDCHDADSIRNHKAADDCTHCHVLCKGC